LGIGLYGINPSPFSKLELKPALQMQSIISSIREVPADEFVGYNITYKAEKKLKVATVPVGYFEGVDRRLSNCGYFKVNGVDCPIVGRVSMNITSIDVSGVSQIKLGDKASIMSSEKGDKNSVESIAKLSNTIAYDILVHIPQHLRHIVI
jgi:alanine racemase